MNVRKNKRRTKAQAPKPPESPSLSDDSAWRFGTRLAFDFIEWTRGRSDEMCLPSDVRDGRPQFNLFLVYLRRLRRRNDPRVDAAFASIMSEYVSGCEDGGCPDLSPLRRLAKSPIAWTTAFPAEVTAASKVTCFEQTSSMH